MKGWPVASVVEGRMRPESRRLFRQVLRTSGFTWNLIPHLIPGAADVLNQRIRNFKWSLGAILLFGAGYLCGQSQLLQPQTVAAQDEESIRSLLSDEANDKLREVFTSLNGATAVLQGESRHRQAIQGLSLIHI